MAMKLGRMFLLAFWKASTNFLLAAEGCAAE
jgi:hypothetical protein